GFYEYAEKINGKLQGNGIRVHELGQRDIREIAAASRIQKDLQPDQVSELEITNIYESNNVVTFDIGMLEAVGCSGLTTLTTASGNFSDGSGLSNYINNMDCSWLIQPTGASIIDLTFTSFDTETGHDTVTV